MSDKAQVLKEMDAIVDTYGAQEHPLPTLIELRRHLAVWTYRLTAHVKQTYGFAGLTYAKRKFTIAQHIVDARQVDAKAALNFLEMSAMKMPSVMAAQKEEIEAEAEKEELKERIRAANGVLNSMQQEIADLRAEKNNTNHQNVGE